MAATTDQEVGIAWSRAAATTGVLTEVVLIAAVRLEAMTGATTAATTGAATVTTIVATIEVAVTSAISEEEMTVVVTEAGMTTVVEEIAGMVTTDTVAVHPRLIAATMTDMDEATTVDHLPAAAMISHGLGREAVTVTSQTLAITVGCHRIGKGLRAAPGTSFTLQTCHPTSPRTLWIMFFRIMAVCKTST